MFDNRDTLFNVIFYCGDNGYQKVRYGIVNT